MKWYEQMNKAVEYIESNLCGEIDFAEISKIIGQSPVNFQRTFSIVTGISVFEYIRRRKMTLAAFEMQNTDSKVINTALKFGYESPEAFTRSFKEIHGVSPTSARKEGVQLKTFPRITFLLTIKGAVSMDYRIETKEAFNIYGIEGIFTTKDGKNLKDIPQFWYDCWHDGRCEKLIKSTNEDFKILHAVCMYRKVEGDNTMFPYMIFANRTKNSDTAGFTEVTIPAATWAVFRTEKHTQAQTAEVLQNLIKRVYTDWLPTAAYRKLDGFELELYFSCGIDEYYCETWIRVEHKYTA
jgi:AraC family transcriptional regulator